MANNKLIKLAKSKHKNVVSDKKETTEENIDVLARERAEKLVSDIDLSIHPNDDDLLEIESETPSPENYNNLEWLQEQLTKLSQENEKLVTEANEAKTNYKKMFDAYSVLKNNSSENELIPDSQIKNGIVELFVEIQNNFLGRNVERRRYTNIVPVPFMNKMIKLFPFLSEYKKI